MPSFPIMRSALFATSARRTLSSFVAPGFAGRAPIEDYPLANRFDEIDTLVIFDDVLIPWRTSCSMGMQRRQA
jgi:hypothetical protein